MTARTQQAGIPAAINTPPHTRAPAKPCVVAEVYHGDGPNIDSCLTLQGLTSDHALEFALVNQVNVLVVATATTIRPSPIARGLNAKLRSLMNLNHVSTHKLGSHFSNPQSDVFTRQSVTHERRMTKRVRETMTTVHHGTKNDPDFVVYFNGFFRSARHLRLPLRIYLRLKLAAKERW